MTFSKQFPLLVFFFFFFFSLLNASEPKRCYSTNCGGNNFDFDFPFWLSPEQSSSCGYPGFNLHCTEGHETGIKLPNSGPFLVREIETQRIRLNDPDNCLARRLLSFNASGSPFSPLHLLNYTFLSCPKDVKSFFLKPIHCLGNSTTSFFATTSELAGAIPSSCQILKRLLLPVSSPLAVDLNDKDLWLKWDTPDCRGCVDFTSICGFVNNTTLQVKCFAYVESGNPWLITVKILSLCLSIPFFLVVTPILCIILIPVKPKSESVPLRNDTPCPCCSICLSEYATEDNVKSLPECQHCFHIECIDTWLKLHNSCPVCRNEAATHVV